MIENINYSLMILERAGVKPWEKGIWEDVLMRCMVSGEIEKQHTTSDIQTKEKRGGVKFSEVDEEKYFEEAPVDTEDKYEEKKCEDIHFREQVS